MLPTTTELLLENYFKIYMFTAKIHLFIPLQHIHCHFDIENTSPQKFGLVVKHTLTVHPYQECPPSHVNPHQRNNKYFVVIRINQY